MTSRLMTAWWRRHPVAASLTGMTGDVAPTRILDWRSAEVQALLADVHAAGSSLEGRALLLRAHSLIVRRVLPVYALDDSQPVSRTLARGRGSCSQRLAVLEAVARAAGVRTRVHGLLIDGRFWYPRFPRLRPFVPDAVILAWPEFMFDGDWVAASELFGPVGTLSGSTGFSNADGETLFEALGRTAVDWAGETTSSASCSACDLSNRVLRDLGRFNSRDDLLSRHGQTICWPARMVGAPVFERWSAGAAAAVA